MPAAYAEARNLVFLKIDIMAASLGHENPKSKSISQMVSAASPLARSDAGIEPIDLQFGKKLESDLQSGSAARKCLVLAMNTTMSHHLVSAVPGYADLQRTMHDALLAQHPEWIQIDGDCPTCEDYDRRFAELLSTFAAFEHAHAN